MSEREKKERRKEAFMNWNANHQKGKNEDWRELRLGGSRKKKRASLLVREKKKKKRKNKGDYSGQGKNKFDVFTERSGKKKETL